MWSVMQPRPRQGRSPAAANGLAGAWRVIAWPFERVRRGLREIDYHSARRTVGRWSRLSDLWIVASIPAALVAVLLTGLLVNQVETRTLARGIMGQLRDGSIEATLTAPGQPIAGAGRFIAAIDLVQERRSASWPVLLWTETDPAMIVVFDGQAPRNIPIRSAAPEAEIVRRSLAKGDPRLLVAASGEHSRQINLGTGFAAVAVTWVVLLPLGLGVIQLARGTAALVARRRERRRRRLEAQLRCVECGYDLHGAEFSARCPECGATLT